MSPSSTHQILRLPRKMTTQIYSRNLLENSWKTSFTMRGWLRDRSEHDPSTIRVLLRTRMIRAWTRQSATRRATSRLLFALSNEHFVLKTTTCSRPKSYTFQISPSTAPATKSDTWPSPSTAPATKSDTGPSPSPAPATKSDTHAWSRHIWNVIYSARSNKVTLQTHQILRLPRKMTTQHLAEICGKQLKRHFQCAADPETVPSMIRAGSEQDPRPFREWTRPSATRRATEVTFRAQDEHFVLKNTTFRAPAILFRNFTKYCACHEKWHWTFTKYCTCHEEWHLTFTKYCACHEKWHLTFTKYCACHEKWHVTFTKYCACHEKWHVTFTKYCTCHEKWLDLHEVLHLLSLDSTNTTKQFYYLTLLLLSDSITWLYYY